MTTERAYVTDTHSLMWYLTADPKLSRRTYEIFQAAQRGETEIIISVIVLAELFYADKKWNLFPAIIETYEELTAKPYFRFVDLRVEDIFDFQIDSAVPEMHDRIIAGLARRLNLPLITSDAAIRDSGVARIVW